MFFFGIVLWEIFIGEEFYVNMYYGVIIGMIRVFYIFYFLCLTIVVFLVIEISFILFLFLYFVFIFYMKIYFCGSFGNYFFNIFVRVIFRFFQIPYL